MKKDINLLTEIKKMKSLMSYLDGSQIIKEEFDMREVDTIEKNFQINDATDCKKIMKWYNIISKEYGVKRFELHIDHQIFKINQNNMFANSIKLEDGGVIFSYENLMGMTHNNPNMDYNIYIESNSFDNIDYDPNIKNKHENPDGFYKKNKYLITFNFNNKPQ